MRAVPSGSEEESCMPSASCRCSYPSARIAGTCLSGWNLRLRIGQACPGDRHADFATRVLCALGRHCRIVRRRVLARWIVVGGRCGERAVQCRGQETQFITQGHAAGRLRTAQDAPRRRRPQRQTTTTRISTARQSSGIGVTEPYRPTQRTAIPTRPARAPFSGASLPSTPSGYQVRSEWCFD